ncbi:MAG: hypothetical protein LBO72_10430 [Helicobacteraceae bacterium]|jgi:DNA-directed RNA polymerase subunit RPC12/RpoP|nr:hypothetical protein [Helicobacteraceae bacterium]
MKRFNDLSYWSFSAYGAYFAVVCPRCRKRAAAIVETGEEKRRYWRYGDRIVFKCAECGAIETKESCNFRYTAYAFCNECNRPFSADVTQAIKIDSAARIACPKCGKFCHGVVRKIVRHCYSELVIKDGRDPHFGYELFYSAVFRGKLIWALNEEHLEYLINYISADLRVKSPNIDGYKLQSDHLPTFMKIAKNRRGILTVLRKMQKIRSR